MAATTAAVLEHSYIHPSPEITAELTLPLVHFDLGWLPYPQAISYLLFFDFPCSKSQFTDTILPKLKQSLIQALNHFLPLAGKIAIPLNHGRPFFRFAVGDSVSLTVAECNTKDFDYLIKNDHPRVCREFYAFVPHLPPAKTSSDEDLLLLPPLAVQITLFPDRGLCLGVTHNHAVCDFSSIVRFIKTWAVLNNNNDINALETTTALLPYYDRSAVADPEGLDKIYWDAVKERSGSSESPPISFPSDNILRQTFVLTGDDIKKLKNSITSKSTTTFAVASAFVWASLMKAEEDGTAADDEPEYYCFPAECRGLLTPPLPEAYFGNCLAFVFALSTRGELRGDGGFAAALASIGEAIRKKVHNEKGILDGAEDMFPAELIGKRMFGVAGSPRFDLYEVDYGWGRPRKIEFEWEHRETGMSLCKSRDFEGGLEIGLSRSKEVLDKFSAVFAKGLKDLSSEE